MPPIIRKTIWPFAKEDRDNLREAAGGGQAVLLIRYGEIGLKGKNRPQFEAALAKQLRNALRPWPQLNVERHHGRFTVAIPDEFPEDKDVELLDAVRSVFGIVSVSPAFRFPPVVESLQCVALAAYRSALMSPDAPSSFKVDSRRSNKSFVWNSMEINRRLGAYLLKEGPPLPVDVRNPDLTVSVEVADEIYVYVDVLRGPGGLPVGSSGRAALLLSGGIDSPVAGWLAMKRGLEIDCIHFHSFPYTSERARQKAIDLARRLTRYDARMRLFLVQVTPIQEAIHAHAPAEFSITLLRRMMVRIAERLARQHDCQALVTGDSLGQVASQTIESLSVTEEATAMPILRPLIAMDKEEIVELAKKIDTYSLSILPYEDCCTVFMPRNPATRPQLERVKKFESMLDVDNLVDKAVADAEEVHLQHELSH